MVLGMQTEKGPVPSHPLENCEDITYIKEKLKLRQIIGVSTLQTRGLALNSLLHMLPYRIKK